jgi:hypothetical protein
MVTLDNLVVTTALPVIRTDLDAGIESLGGAPWQAMTFTASL